ncbi:MAG: AhpC/TSA family protein [Holophagaceae bacterium]|nr:AhpC/TSA family protein [Holophagaceae bacterium]
MFAIPMPVPAIQETARPETTPEAAMKRSLKEGALAPDFTLPGADGKPVALSALLAKGPVILAFYRGAWCPFCNVQLGSYQKALARFQAKGATLVAVSPQVPEKGEAMAQKHQLTFPVLSDLGLKVARSYGLVFKAPANYTFLPEFNGDASGELPLAATFVIGQDRRILKAFGDPDYKQRASVEDLLAALPNQDK